MARSDRAGMPEGPKRPLLSLLRESGDALEAASPPFDAAAAASRLREAATAYGFLRAEGIPEDHRAVTGAELEVEAPPFDVETGAARLREAARARGLLSSASEHSAQRIAGLATEMPGNLTGRSGRTGQGMSGQPARGQFGIGEVLAQLRPEFPDISTSRIRFLEAKGLIEPARSRSGYRRFSARDIDRLRYIFTMQRDSRLPLQVIRERLADGLRIAVVGIGNSGSQHVRVLRSATGVAAIAGVDQRFSKTGDAGQEIDHGVTAYSCIEDALPNVDAVIIATPPDSHAPLALQAIEAGKHVLIEQPMATTTQAARHLIDAANSAGVLLMPVAFDEPLAVQDQHFIDCIIYGSRPSVDGSSGLAVVQALESAQISLYKQRMAALAQATPPKAVEPGHLPDDMSTRGILPTRPVNPAGGPQHPRGGGPPAVPSSPPGTVTQAGDRNL